MENENNKFVKEADQDVTIESFFVKLGKGLVNGLPVLVAILIAIWWILQGTIGIVPTALTLKNQIIVFILTVILGFSYRYLLGQRGFKSAKETKEFIGSLKSWLVATKNAKGKRKEINLFAKDIAKQNRKEIIEENCENNGIVYKKYFNEKAVLINQDFTGLTKHQIKVIKKCSNIKIRIPELFGKLSSKFFGIETRETQKQYEMKQNIMDALTAIVFAAGTVSIAFVYYGFSIQSMIYSLFQIVLWTGSAMVKRIKNFKFVTDKLVPQMDDNTTLIEEYLSKPEEEQKTYTARVLKLEKELLKGDN